MSYQVVGGPAARSRPGAVTTASILLYVAGALVLGIGALGTVDSLQNVSTMAGTNVNGAQLGAGELTTVAIVGGVIHLLVGAGFVILGLQVGKGRNPARIVTWVAAGIVALCCGCGQVLTVAGQSVIGGLPADAGVGAELPSTAVNVSDAVLSVLLVLVLVIVIVLLSLPVSNDFFRKEQEAWVPPAWPAGYPGGYGYPAAGYPQPPAVPQYPYQPQPPPPSEQPQQPPSPDQPQQWSPPPPVDGPAPEDRP